MPNVKWKTRRADLILWMIVAVLAIWGAIFVSVDFLHSGELNRIGFAIVVALFAMCLTGVSFRWGPTIPCAVLGMLIASVVTSPVAKSAMEGVYKDLGVPIIGAIAGALIGILLDGLRSSQISEESPFRNT